MTKAKVRDILLGVNDIGDRDYTLVLQFSDDLGQDAVGFYTYETKSTYEVGQDLGVTYSEMSGKKRKRLEKKHKDVDTHVSGRIVYAAEPVNAQQYVDANAITFTKNQHLGDKTMFLYMAMVTCAALVAILYGAFIA